MTIHVTCQCGKQLHAPDEFAGRQTRCPACKQPVTLPVPPAAIQPAPTPVATLTPTPPAAVEPASLYEAPAELPLGAPITSGKALWSLILGLVSMFCVPFLPAIPAVILGFLGMREIKRNPQTLRGKGMAVAGLILGLLNTTATCVAGIVAIVVFSWSQSTSEKTSVNHLKQIGIACHVHHDAFLMFPSEAGHPANGMVQQPGSKLSWRVQILPYIEENNVYSQFHQDEPWDSPHNIQLLPRMPRIYLDPRFQTIADRDKGMTYYRAFVGPGGVLGASPPTDLMKITNANGASNTILVIEAGEPVPWTKPEDPSFNETSPFGGPGRKDFYALFGDGHVQKLRAKTDPALIRKMINWQNTDPFQIP